MLTRFTRLSIQVAVVSAIMAAPAAVLKLEHPQTYAERYPLIQGPLLEVTVERVSEVYANGWCLACPDARPSECWPPEWGCQ